MNLFMHNIYYTYLYNQNVGFNVESVDYKSIHIVSWDVGGRCNLVRLFF